MKNFIFYGNNIADMRSSKCSNWGLFSKR